MGNIQAINLEEDELKIEYKPKWNNNLNCFLCDYLPWSRPRNWFSNIAQFFRNFKWAWQRATKGYSDRDTWGLCDYYTQLFQTSIKQLAAEAHGWPSSEEVPTFRDWQEILLEISDHFYKAYEGNEDDLHPEIMQYFDEMQSHITSVESVEEHSETFGKVWRMDEHYDDEEAYNAARQKWWDATRQADNERQEHLEKGLALLLKHYNGLWD